MGGGGVVATAVGQTTLARAEAKEPPQKQADADPAKPKRCWRVSLTGELLCASAGNDFAEEVKRAKAARAEAMLVQIGARKWRGDAVRDLGRAIANAELPVHVVLKAEEQERVGIGALIAGMNAASLWIAPGTSVIGVPGDRVASTSTAKASKEESAALVDMAEAALSRRGGPDELGGLLVTPNGPRWLVTKGKQPRIVVDRPGTDGADATEVFSNEADGVRVALSGERALAARLIDDVLGGDAAFKRLGFLPARPRPESAIKDAAAFSADSTMQCDPDAEYNRVVAGLAAIDDALVAATKKLNPPGSGKPSGAVRAEVAREVEQISASLADLEEVLKGAPELTQRPVPGMTEVGTRNRGWPAKWRSAIQERREKITRLQARTK